VRALKPLNSHSGNIYGELTVNLLGRFAEFETNLRKERQAEGIAKAKALGVYKGRPPSIDVMRIRELKRKGWMPPRSRRRLKSDEHSYRVLE